MTVPLVSALAQTRKPESVAQVGNGIAKHLLQKLSPIVLSAFS
jgi:hypothetical protein